MLCFINVKKFRSWVIKLMQQITFAEELSHKKEPKASRLFIDGEQHLFSLDKCFERDYWLTMRAYP